VPRFTGTITGLAAVEQGGQVTGWDVRATGTQARLGVTPVLLDRPAETDVARVQAIATAAGTPLTVAGTPGVTLAADTIDRDALSALHQVCESSAGMIWQARDGGIWYGAADHRDQPPTSLLPAGAVVDGITWDEDIEGIVNHVTVKWGPENAQQQNTHRDQPSIDRWGMRHADVNTMCADQVNADQLGLLILARRKDPYFRMPGVLLDVDALSVVDFTTATMLEVSTPVLLPVLPTPSPTPAQPTGWVVEGWVERWTVDGHWMQLAVSDAARSISSGLRSWADVAGQPWSVWAAGSWLEQLVEVA
jgi:hypothetical protein